MDLYVVNNFVLQLFFHILYNLTGNWNLNIDFFLTQGVSKRKDLMKIPKVIYHIKPIPSHIMRM